MSDTTKTLGDSMAELADNIEAYNKWRRGSDLPHPDPEAIGVWLSAAVDVLRAQAAQAQAEASGPDSNPLNVIGEAIGIGKAARTLDVILANIENAIRRAACLSAVEREFFTREVPGDDDDLYEECLLNWGHEPDEYVATFRAALAAQAQAQAEPVAVPDGRLRALEAAVSALYFDDSSDFRAALGSVICHLDERLAGEMLCHPKAAFDRVQAMLAAPQPAQPERQPLTDEQWLKRFTHHSGQRLKPGARRDELLSLIRWVERNVAGAKGGAA